MRPLRPISVPRRCLSPIRKDPASASSRSEKIIREKGARDTWGETSGREPPPFGGTEQTITWLDHNATMHARLQTVRRHLVVKPHDDYAAVLPGSPRYPLTCTGPRRAIPMP